MESPYVVVVGGASTDFIAALAVAMVEGQPWKQAGWFANAAAALTTTQLGAAPDSPSVRMFRRFSQRSNSENKVGTPRSRERRLAQWLLNGINDTAIEMAISTMIIHSRTSMRRVVARLDILS